MLLLWSVRPRAQKGRFLRVFAGFCSFIVNILAMRRTIQTGLLNSFYWQFAKILSSKLASLRRKGEKMNRQNVGLNRGIEFRRYDVRKQSADFACQLRAFGETRRY